jgi:hypothetical protein
LIQHTKAGVRGGGVNIWEELTCSNLLKLCIRNLVEWDVAVEGGDGGCESEVECSSKNLQNFAKIGCRTVSAATFFQVCAQWIATGWPVASAHGNPSLAFHCDWMG